MASLVSGGQQLPPSGTKFAVWLILSSSGCTGMSLWLSAIALTLVADACFAAVVWHGPTTWRLAALAAMLPTLYVVADLLRRAPHSF
jgi:hypothetical protein